MYIFIPFIRAQEYIKYPGRDYNTATLNTTLSISLQSCQEMCNQRQDCVAVTFALQICCLRNSTNNPHSSTLIDAYVKVRPEKLNTQNQTLTQLDNSSQNPEKPETQNQNLPSNNQNPTLPQFNSSIQKQSVSPTLTVEPRQTQFLPHSSANPIGENLTKIPTSPDPVIKQTTIPTKTITAQFTSFEAVSTKTHAAPPSSSPVYPQNSTNKQSQSQVLLMCVAILTFLVVFLALLGLFVVRYRRKVFAKQLQTKCSTIASKKAFNSKYDTMDLRSQF